MTTSFLRKLSSHAVGALSVAIMWTLITIQMVAAQVTISADVSPKTGRLSDLFLFTVTIQGLRSAAPPQLANSEDFDLTLIGPRSSVSIINGTMSSKISYVYQLVPKREGLLRTPKATIEIDAKAFIAEPVEVTIHGQGQAVNHPPSDSDALLLRQSVTPTTAYEGQQLVHSLTMYTRIDLSEISMEEPTLDGFWQEDIANNQRGNRRFNTLEYTTIESSQALFPLRSGKITIPKHHLRAKTPTQRQVVDPFSFDFFTDNLFQQFFREMDFTPVGATSNDVSLEIKPLPAMPADLRESAPPVVVVGATTLKLSYPLEAINTGEPKSIAIEVTSEGNLNTLKSLPIKVPPQFKVYEEKPDTRVNPRSGKLITHKTFRYSLIPLTPGLARVPGVRLIFFNPQSGTYEIAMSSDIAFPVRGADLLTASSQSERTTDRDNKDTSSDDSPLPATPLMEYDEPPLSERVSRYISAQSALLIFVALCGVACVALVARARKSGEETIEVSPGALSEVASMKDLESFVRDMISAKLERVSENSTLDELRSRVATKLPDQSLSLAIRSLLDDIEVYTYGKGDSEPEINVHALKERLEMILTRWH